MLGEENIKIRLEIIMDKLTKLKKLDEKFSGFGSSDHQYELISKLSQKDINKYQKKNNITLPEEYAQFLMHVGNGGAGPCYGLFPLEENENPGNLSEVFPYDIDNPFYFLGKYDEFYERMDNCETFEEEDALCEEKDKLWGKDYDNCAKGIIDLCHEGCGMYNVLIVNGKDKGTVWYFDVVSEFGVAPLLNPKDGKPMGFLDWYEFWLDEQIAFMEGNSQNKRGFGSFSSYAARPGDLR